LTSTGGVVQLRDFTDGLQGYTDCLASITVSAGRGIKLTITEFDLNTSESVSVSNTSNHSSLFYVWRISLGAEMIMKLVSLTQVIDAQGDEIMVETFTNQITPFVVNTSTSKMTIKYSGYHSLMPITRHLGATFAAV
jgi:hypothetical protein